MKKNQKQKTNVDIHRVIPVHSLNTTRPMSGVVIKKDARNLGVFVVSVSGEVCTGELYSSHLADNTQSFTTPLSLYDEYSKRVLGRLVAYRVITKEELEECKRTEVERENKRVLAYAHKAYFHRNVASEFMGLVRIMKKRGMTVREIRKLADRCYLAVSARLEH